jgi:hypothetical protein
VTIKAADGLVNLRPTTPTLPGVRMQFRVETSGGKFIQVVDYVSVNNWNGKHICTWLPTTTPRPTGAKVSP